jgi:hypothetical protein
MTSPYEVPRSSHASQSTSETHWLRVLTITVCAVGVSTWSVLFQIDRAVSAGRSPTDWASIAGYLFYGDVGFLLAGVPWIVFIAGPATLSRRSAVAVWGFLGIMYAAIGMLVFCPLKFAQDIGGFLFILSYIAAFLSSPFCLYSCVQCFKTPQSTNLNRFGEVTASCLVVYHGSVWGVLFTYPLLG